MEGGVETGATQEECFLFVLQSVLLEFSTMYIHYLTKNNTFNWAPVAHTCNPSYSGGGGGRDQGDHGSKPAQANSSQDPSQKKKKITKKGW
jgi:hypothetical protein